GFWGITECKCRSLMAVKHFKCAWEHCGGKIEYPAEAVGLSTTCPHCGKETDLTLPPPVEVADGRRRIVWLWIAAAILLIGIVAVAAAFLILNYLAQRGTVY